MNSRSGNDVFLTLLFSFSWDKIIHVASNPLRETSFLSNLTLISINTEIISCIYIYISTSESALLVEITIKHAQMSVTRDLSSGSPSSYNSGSKLVDALGIAGIVVAVITAIAGILALFQGWKCWERRNNTNRDSSAAAAGVTESNIGLPGPSTNIQIPALHPTTSEGDSAAQMMLYSPVTTIHNIQNAHIMYPYHGPIGNGQRREIHQPSDLDDPQGEQAQGLDG
ncbi:hypothetical protein P167DRAFT_582822 [Morchella conica CCBAS932]|uniref:Uncharacterized protein n=1 Tax=Morchella conica CCBAS932 TaxID=1392247 RepID=A0A3N4KVX5_9PEZI|nr:hypothetical protein P167DRAFT_582822 [Morchella conica CCBAS932]